MTLQLIFLVLMLIWLVFGMWSVLPAARADWKVGGNWLLPFILFLILRWHAFGAPIQGR